LTGSSQARAVTIPLGAVRVRLAAVMTTRPGKVLWLNPAGFVLCAAVGCFNPGGSATTGGAAGSVSGADTTDAPEPEETTLAGETDGTGTSSATSAVTTSGATATTSEQSTGQPEACGDAVQLGAEECDDGNTRDADGCSATCKRERVVFVTSGTYGVPEIAGVAGANALCNSVAAASGNARLTGKTFAAWLGDAATSAAMQVGVSEGPYYLADEPPTRIADNTAGLSGTLMAPIVVTEQGVALAPGFDCLTGLGLAWTGSEATGLSVPDVNCGGWTSGAMGFGGAAGRLQAVSAEWSYACTVTCDMPLHLYCFEK
jgi:cysteine-rich repeat protein